ncbi:MAG: hypothetical protein NBKEAIPA_03133 [Nitrospirae bacterium]|nr:hypothetical protein [Nitrospirota bacterium]
MQQAVRIFVCATLPGTLEVTEIDLYFGRENELFMPRQFHAAIPGQGSTQGCRPGAYVPAQRRHHTRRFFLRYLDQHGEARLLLYQRGDV